LAAGTRTFSDEQALGAKRRGAHPLDEPLDDEATGSRLDQKRRDAAPAVGSTVAKTVKRPASAALVM
jgi:hypothetical protein